MIFNWLPKEPIDDDPLGGARGAAIGLVIAGGLYLAVGIGYVIWRIAS